MIKTARLRYSASALDYTILELRDLRHSGPPSKGEVNIERLTLGQFRDNLLSSVPPSITLEGPKWSQGNLEHGCNMPLYM